MTSLSLRKKPKLAQSLLSDHASSDCSSEREGIFDQFSEDSSGELYYYAVYSSSDSEGNISVVDVKREKFDPDIKIIKREDSDEEWDEEEEEKIISHPKKRYGFRTRRLRKHRDDEFETSLCDTSDESAKDESKAIPSSDDETYDITTDNWAFVRGAKKKTTEKKNESPKKINENSPKKTTPLKIRLKSAFRKKKESKLQKMAENLKKEVRNLMPIKHAQSGTENRPKKGVPNHAPKRKTDSPTKSPSKSSNTQSSLLKSTSPPFPKKSPNRIRCGYNPTGPKIQEIRHIRRRQLRQTPSRVNKTGASIYDEGSSSSDEDFNGESPEAGGMRTRKISRIESEHNLRNEKGTRTTAPPSGKTAATSRGRVTATSSEKTNSVSPKHDKISTSTRKVESVVTGNQDSAKTPRTESPTPMRSSPRLYSKLLRAKVPKSVTTATSSVKTKTLSGETTTTVTPNGSGLKLVIRRQSIDPPKHTVQEAGNVSPTETKNFDPKARGKFSPGILGAKKMQILKTVNLKPTDVAEKRQPIVLLRKSPQLEKIKIDNQEQEKAEEKDNILDVADDKNSVEGPAQSTKVTSENDSKQVTCTNNKLSPEDDPTKRKKSKKKRKKDRGRNGSTAGTDDAFDAQHTAMRLAMELPRHNWLVNSLIKEKKLKAEDDKPLNNVPEGEEANTQANTEGNTASKTEQENQSPSVNADSADTKQQQPANPTEDDTPPQTEEQHPTDEGRKHTNAVKGSSMVGIVKPFQHLKMSPANMEVGEMSPPMLCIADEDEDSQNQGNVNNTEHNTGSCTTPNKRGEDELCKTASGVEKTTKDLPPEATCGSMAKSCAQNSINAVAQHILEVSKRQMLPCNNNNTVTVNVAEIVTSGVKDFSKPDFESKTKPESEHEAKESHITPEVKGQALELNAKSQKVDAGNNIETEPEIKISNCFSLALDLTKKVEKTFVKKSPESNQPLDLSTRPKSAEKSPKILDLSVKRPQTITTPKTQTPVLSKTPELPQNKPFVSRSIETKIEPAQPPPQQPQLELPNPQYPTDEPSKPQPPKDTVIVIEDDSSEVKKIVPKSPPKTPTTPVPLLQTHQTGNTRLTSPLTSPLTKSRPVSASGNVPAVYQQMKRPASCDLTPIQDPSGIAPAKRARMSLDEAKLVTKSVENQIPPVQTAVQRHPQKQVPVSPKPDVQIRKSVPDIRGQSSIQHVGKQHMNQGEKTLSDLLFSKVPQPPKPQHNPIPPPTNAPASFPAPMVRRTPPGPVLAPAISGSNYIPTPRFTPADFNNNNMISRPRVSPKQTPPDVGAQFTPPKKPTRHRSLDSSNSAAQLVAKAYHPSDMRQLEPYIKEQQRVVDQKIQELEAIKRQLANASACVNDNTAPPPPPPYQIPGKVYNLPPMQRPPPVPRKTSPSAQFRNHLVPQAPIRAPYNQHPAMSQAHPRPMQQSKIVQSQYQRPPPPPASHPANRVHHSLVHHPPPPPPRTTAQHPWRLLPPQSEATMVQHHQQPYQRSISTGGQPVTVHQNMALRQSHPVYRPPQQVPTNQQQMFSRPTTTPTQRLPNQIPTPAAYQQRQVQQSHVQQRPQIPVPRITAANTAPVYRNGGLTVHDNFKTRLNEPIVIEDDIIRSGGVQNPRKRPGQPQPMADSLKVRRAHSYHPPLSRNRTEQAQNAHWNGRPATGNYQVSQQRPSVAEAQGEVCVKCGKKAFFLCSGCRKMWYCSKDCQVKDWTTHSSKCSG